MLAVVRVSMKEVELSPTAIHWREFSAHGLTLGMLWDPKITQIVNESSPGMWFNYE